MQSRDIDHDWRVLRVLYIQSGKNFLSLKFKASIAPTLQKDVCTPDARVAVFYDG